MVSTSEKSKPEVEIIRSKPPRVPPPVQGIQINCCLNPECPNYGNPPNLTAKRGRGNISPDNYRMGTSKKSIDVVSEKGKTKPVQTKINEKVMVCKLCKRSTAVKSNLATLEEWSRISSYLDNNPRSLLPSCPNSECGNHGITWEIPGEWLDSFFRNGHDKNGNPRVKCKECGRTLTLREDPLKPHGNHKKPHKNSTVFNLIVNKVPLSRICEIAGINPSTLYGKIKYICRQCERFSGHRERRLIDGRTKLGELRISVDQQFHLVNWNQRKDKRNIQLLTIASADNISGYIFGTHTNFDPSMDTVVVEKIAEKTGDARLLAPFRRFARIWLEKDYSESTAKSDIRKSLDDGEEPEDENCEKMHSGLRIPAKGVQIHAEYTVFAHFMLLRKMLERAEKIDIYIDVDHVLKKGCLYFFMDRIKKGRCDAFFVSINKNFSIDEKRKRMQDANQWLKQEMMLRPGLTEQQVRKEIIVDKIAAEQRYLLKCEKNQIRREPWVWIPFPRMDEPEKKVLCLTRFRNEDPGTMADGFLRAGLYGVDTFFQQTRRRISPLERPLHSSSAKGRIWSGYSPYNPAMVQDYVTILRTFHNYVLGSDEGRGPTPAMKLGLARGPVRISDILYFKGGGK